MLLMLSRNWMDVISFGTSKIKVTSCWTGAETNRYFRISMCSLVFTPVISPGAILYGVCSLKESSLKSLRICTENRYTIVEQRTEWAILFWSKLFYVLVSTHIKGTDWCLLIFLKNKNIFHFAFPAYFTFVTHWKAIKMT